MTDSNPSVSARLLDSLKVGLTPGKPPVLKGMLGFQRTAQIEDPDMSPSDDWDIQLVEMRASGKNSNPQHVIEDVAEVRQI